MTMLEAIVNALWVMSAFTSWYALICLLLWVTLWGIRFRWYDTEIGQNFWSFVALLLALILNNFIGAVGATGYTGREWWEPAPNDFFFFYVTRYLIFLGVAIVITRMLLLLRKHWRAGISVRVDMEFREHSKPKTGSSKTVPPAVDTPTS